MRRVFILILLALLFIGCSPRIITTEIPVETIKVDYKNTIQHDTVIIRDSVDRYFHGDTVLITKIKTVYKYKNRVDTVIKVDTIPTIITKTEIKEITTNKTNGFQNFLIWLGIICLAYIVIKKVILRL